MGWFDYHLWGFTVGKQKYGLPMGEDWGSRQRLMASKVRLRDVLQPRKTVLDYTNADHWRRGQQNIPLPPRLTMAQREARPLFYS
jgi:hypothetical protein